MTFLSNWSHPTCLCDYYFWRSENTAELLNSMIHARVCVCICKSMFSCRKTKGSNMGMPKPFLLLLLLIVTVSASQKQRTIEARALSSLPQPSKYVHIYRNFTLRCLSNGDYKLIDVLLLTMSMRFVEYSKIFPTLGVVCKCCDSTGPECATTWTGSCHDLQCLPWKI
jgi:hypothetical protein